LSYPTVARLAQIQGDVRLKLLIDKTGRIASVYKIEGPDALAVTAAKEIQEWRYTATNQSWHATVIIHYFLQKPALAVAPVARAAIDTPFRVSVASNYPLPTGNPEVMTPK
jgi:Gram-negative bacterial TonB protein C-terminal